MLSQPFLDGFCLHMAHFDALFEAILTRRVKKLARNIHWAPPQHPNDPVGGRLSLRFYSNAPVAVTATRKERDSELFNSLISEIQNKYPIFFLYESIFCSGPAKI